MSGLRAKALGSGEVSLGCAASFSKSGGAFTSAAVASQYAVILDFPDVQPR